MSSSQATAAAATVVRPVLYSYWRSSCSWRVRIALHVKGIPFEQRTVNVLGGEHRDATSPLAKKLPFGLVPALVVIPNAGNGGDEVVLAESMAIIEYLEEKFPDRQPLLPGTPEDRARIRALSLLIIADTQPLQNLGVLQHLSAEPEKRKEWAQHWIRRSFAHLEAELARCAGTYAYGDQLSLLDCCIPPQVYNAKRFGIDMSAFPTIERVERALALLPAFQAADARHQPDTPPEERLPPQ